VETLCVEFFLNLIKGLIVAGQNLFRKAMAGPISFVAVSFQGKVDELARAGEINDI
jgi:hypothetical protein